MGKGAEKSYGRNGANLEPLSRLKGKLREVEDNSVVFHLGDEQHGDFVKIQQSLTLDKGRDWKQNFQH